MANASVTARERPDAFINVMSATRPNVSSISRADSKPAADGTGGVAGTPRDLHVSSNALIMTSWMCLALLVSRKLSGMVVRSCSNRNLGR
jgi:hypothetical protein